MLLKPTPLAALLTLLIGCAGPKQPPIRTSAEPIQETPETIQEEPVTAVPPIAIVLVMDRSGSMFGPKADGARNAAKTALRTLPPHSLFGFVAFDNLPDVIVPLQVADERAAIEASIDAFVVGGGTDLLPALHQAEVELDGVEAERRHILLLSDGRAPDSGLEEMVARIRGKAITISCVGIGDFDHQLLEKIADGGRVQVADLPTDLSELFAMDVRRVMDASSN